MKKTITALFALAGVTIGGTTGTITLNTPKESPIICSIGEDGSTKYFRDDANLHFVPKRQAEDVIVK